MMIDFSKVPAFLVIGAGCYVLGLASVFVLTSVIGIHYLISNVLALAIVYPVGFYLNKVFNFRSRGTVRTELLRYYLASLGVFSVSLGAIYILVRYFGVWYMTANVTVSCAQVAFGFLVLDRWVFRR
jgi:putative flippase GtrA